MKIQTAALILMTALTLAPEAYAANPKIQTLVCQNGDAGAGQGSVTVTLDSGSFSEGSGYSLATNTTVWYMFSSVDQMVCDGHKHNDEYDIQCIGYYAGREPTEVKIINDGDKVVALWKTSKAYGNLDMRSECTLGIN